MSHRQETTSTTWIFLRLPPEFVSEMTRGWTEGCWVQCVFSTVKLKTEIRLKQSSSLLLDKLHCALTSRALPG